MSRITPLENAIHIELDGEQLPAREGEPVAAALIAHGELLFSRSLKYHRPRGAYCLTGGCSHCLMRVNGVPNVPTCRVEAKPGMRLERQNALPDAKVDVLRATDFVFQKWFNHHEFLAGVPLAEPVMLKIARQLSGLGVLPNGAQSLREAACVERHRLVIVGAGAAGLAAAKRLSELGREYLLLERDAVVGGRLTSAAEAHQPSVWQPPTTRVRTKALVVGCFADDGDDAKFLAVIQGERLHLVYFEKLLLTVGGQPEFHTFENNDLPGIMAGRAVATLVRRHGVLVGKRVAVCGEPNEARELAALLKSHGVHTVLVGAEVREAHGFGRLEAVTARLDGKEQKERCDALALCGPMNPSFELARAAGADVEWEPRARTFRVQANTDGRTSQPRVYVAGEIRGPMSSGAAAEQGIVCAEALAKELP